MFALQTSKDTSTWKLWCATANGATLFTFNLFSVQTNESIWSPSTSSVRCHLMCSRVWFYCCIIKLFGVTPFWLRRASDMCVRFVYVPRWTFFAGIIFIYFIYILCCDCDAIFGLKKTMAILWCHMCWKRKCCNKMGLNVNVLGFSLGDTSMENNCDRQMSLTNAKVKS